MVTEKKSSQPYLQWIQLGVLCIGVSGIFVDIGRKTELLANTNTELKDLKNIVQDLIKSQIIFATNDARQEAILDNLRDRISDIERKQ